VSKKYRASRPRPLPVHRKNDGTRRLGLDWRSSQGEKPMAKPNYSFEKRQREIAKKKKQDEKLAKKQAAKDAANPPPPDHGETPSRGE
jgi:hypothetical protein